MSHADEHDDHGHAPAPEPPEEPRPTPPHVRTIARITNVVGMALWAGGFLLAWILLWQSGFGAFAWSAFASLYGFCIWLAARDTLARPTA